MFGNLFSSRPPKKGMPMIPEMPANTGSRSMMGNDRKATYSKVFRWRMPDGQTAEPKTVEVAGTFNHWQRVELQRDGVLDAWHATVHHIPGGRPHHYMLFVDGQPAYDKNADGLAVPHGSLEEAHQLMTARGPRVFMMFAQTK